MSFAFHAFVSYSTDPDYRLSQRVESFLETFHKIPTPADVDLVELAICRDGSDFSIQSLRGSAASGSKTSAIEAMLAEYLAQSEYLIVLCSAKTPHSPFVAFEIRWFLENRDADHVLLAVTGGSDPASAPGEVFPAAAIEAGIHGRPFYDLRGFHRRASRGWTKVRDLEEELANLAAHLQGDTSGRLLPLWQRETLRRARRQRWIFAGVSALLLLFSVVALWQRHEAVRSQRETEKALQVARARSLVLGAEAIIERDPELSFLLAIEAARRTWDSQGEILPAAASLLQRTLLANPRRIPMDASVEAFAWSPDGRMLAVGNKDGTVVVVSADTLQRVKTFRGQDWIESVDWTADGSLLASASKDGRVVVWDVQRGERLGELAYGHGVQSVDWRAGTRQLAAGLAIGPASRIDVHDWTARRKLFDVPGIRARWSPDAALLASDGIDGTVRIFSAGGEELATMPGHSRYVHSVRWNNAGDRFATASVDDRVMVWSAAERKRLATLDAQFELSAAWSPDGRRLASGTGSDFVKIWGTERYELVFRIGAATTITGRPFAGPRGYILEVAWSPDGKTFAASDRGASFGGGAGSLLLYPSSLFDAGRAGEILAVAQALAPRELTGAERRQFLVDAD